jgi:hypothetical protein
MWLIGGTVGTPAQDTSAGSISEMQLPLIWVAIGMVATLVLTWVIFRWRKARSRRRLNSPRLLLRDLFRLHQLSWSDRRLLLQAAKRQKVATAARLFLEPELWQKAIESEKLPARQRQLKTLHKRLLGD